MSVMDTKEVLVTHMDSTVTMAAGSDQVCLLQMFEHEVNESILIIFSIFRASQL